MIQPTINELQDRFCPEIQYKENGDKSGSPCGYITFDMNIPNNDTINVLADAIFAESPECRWFLITIPYSDNGFNEKSYWPRAVIKEIIVGDEERVRYIIKYDYLKESQDDMKRMIDEYGKAAIGITSKQHQVGVNALAEDRARDYVKRARSAARTAYTQRLKEIKEVEKLLNDLQ